MGICIIAAYATQYTGGVQRQILLQSREFANRGLKVFIMQREDSSLIDEKLKDWSHVEFISIKVPKLKYFSALFFILKGLIKFIRVRNKISVVHAHQASSTAILAVFIKLFFKKPVVVKVTSGGGWGEIQELRSQKLFFIRNIFYKYVDQWIALAAPMKAELINLFHIPAEKITIIPNGVAVRKFNPLNYNKIKPFTILYCGRLSLEKRLDTLLQAADLLSLATKATITVQLVGPVYLERDPSSLIENIKSKFKGNVVIEECGEKKNVLSFYESANAFVLPSESEGMSNSLLEAMSAGTVCIVSDIPENRSLITHEETGLVFDTQDPSSLATQLLRIFGDQYGKNGDFSKNLILNARSLIENNYSAEAVCNRLIHIYETVQKLYAI